MSRGAIYAGKAAILITIQDAVDKGLMGVRNKLNRFANSVGSAGGSALRGGILGSIGSGFLLKKFTEFSDELLNLQTKLGIFGKPVGQVKVQFDGLVNTIRHLGRTTSFTSKEVAEAATELAQAGFNMSEIQNTLQATLDLARGSNYGVAESASILANTIRTFNLDARQAENVASMFVRATRLGTIGIEDLREALKYIAGTAYNLEQTLPTVLGMLVQLSETGLKGSLGGTSPNVAMLNMIANLEKAKDVLPGIALQRTADGKFDFIGTLKALYAITNQMDAIEKTKVFQKIFNIRGARAISGLQEVNNLEKYIKSIERSGPEARLAAMTRDQDIGGAARRATSALDDLGKTIGNIVSPAVKGLLEAVAPAAAILDNLAKRFPGVTTALVAMPFALAAAGAGMLTLSMLMRRAAGAAGMLLSAWRPISNMAVGGTIRQMGAMKTASRAISKSGSIKGIGLGILGAAKGTASGIGRTGLALRGIQGGWGVLRSFGAAFKGAKIAEGAKAIWTLTKGFLGLARAMARFVFSWGGVWTIFELLLLFGHKIDAVAKGFERLTTGFSRFGSEIMRIGTLFSGPIKLFTAGLDILAKGDGKNSDLGLGAMVGALQAMVGIVKGQLVAAWNRVVFAIAPVWDFLSKTVQSLYEVIKLLVDATSGVIGGRISALVETFKTLTGGSGEKGQGWNSFFKGLVLGLGAFIDSFFNGLDIMGGIFDQFVYSLQKVLVNIIDAMPWIPDKTVKFMEADNSAIRMAQNVAENQRKIDRAAALKAFNSRVEQIFKQNTSKKAISGITSGRSQADASAQSAWNWLEQLGRDIQARVHKALPPLPGTAMAGAGGTRLNAFGGALQFEQPPSGAQAMAAQLEAQRKLASTIVDALVGGASETRHQLLRKGVSEEDLLKKQEKHQAEMEKTLKSIDSKTEPGGVQFG